MSPPEGVGKSATEAVAGRVMVRARPAAIREVLDTLAAILASGKSLPEALGLLREVRPTTGKWALQASSAIAGGASLASTLAGSWAWLGRARAGLCEREAALLASAQAGGFLLPALRLVARDRGRGEALARVFRRALIGPAIFLVLTLVLEPLPRLLLGGSVGGALGRGLLELAIGLAAIKWVVPRLWARSGVVSTLCALSARLPIVGAMVRSRAELAIADALAALGEESDAAGAFLTAAASLIAWRSMAAELGQAARAGSREAGIRSLLASGVVSEPLALALVAARDPAQASERLTRFGDGIEARLAGSIRALVLVLGYSVVTALGVADLVALLRHPIPGLGVGAGGSLDLDKQLEELQRALDGVNQ